MSARLDATGQSIERAAELIAEADGLVITAGAGMGVESGLPEFRGEKGFWRAYPALGARGMDFTAIANPAAFQADARLAWGFYGHRLALYRRTRPHAGFGILRQWAARMTHGARVFTSNVDGQFQAIGFADAQIVECHGSIHALQCLEPCSDAVWSAAGFEPQVDEAAGRLVNALPRCPLCGGVARPNILMFGDWGWIDAKPRKRAGLQRWLGTVAKPVVVEIGAGTAVSSVRHFAQGVAREFGGRLVRINPADSAVPDGLGVGIALGALEALRRIDGAMKRTSAA